jgi:hypothetical protein
MTIGSSDATSKRLIFQGSGSVGYEGGINWQRDNAIDNSITVDSSESLSINFAQSDLAGRALLFKSGSAGTERMRIDGATGNVGIGTSSPNVNLEILSGGTFTGAIRVGDSGSSRRLILEQTDVLTYTIGGTGTSSVTRFVSGGSSGIGTERMRINASGHLLVGVSSQINAGFQCNQFNGTTQNGLVLKTTRAELNSTFAVFVNSAGAGCGSVIQNGTTTVNYAASSDRRLKENISDSDDSGSVIDAIKVRKFDWIGTDEHERY